MTNLTIFNLLSFFSRLQIGYKRKELLSLLRSTKQTRHNTKRLNYIQSSTGRRRKQQPSDSRRDPRFGHGNIHPKRAQRGLQSRTRAALVRARPRMGPPAQNRPQRVFPSPLECPYKPWDRPGASRSAHSLLCS